MAARPDVFSMGWIVLDGWIMRMLLSPACAPAHRCYTPGAGSAGGWPAPGSDTRRRGTGGQDDWVRTPVRQAALWPPWPWDHPWPAPPCTTVADGVLRDI